MSQNPCQMTLPGTFKNISIRPSQTHPAARFLLLPGTMSPPTNLHPPLPSPSLPTSSASLCPPFLIFFFNIFSLGHFPNEGQCHSDFLTIICLSGYFTWMTISFKEFGSLEHWSRVTPWSTIGLSNTRDHARHSRAVPKNVSPKFVSVTISS